MILYQLLPVRVRPYAKTVVASAGLVLASVLAVLPAAPRPLFVALALLVALGVYGQPNTVDEP